MKINYLLPILLLFFSISNAQIEFQENVIIGQEHQVLVPELLQHPNPDIDNDGDNDIIIQTARDIGWYENLNGNGNFDYFKTFYNSGTGINDSQLFDIDNDNDLDIIAFASVSSQGGSSDIVRLQNDGQGSFTIEVINVLSWDPYKSTIVDIDNDGDIDIIATSFGGKLSWFENNGSGDFNIEHVIATNINSYAITSGDVDNDNDPDIIVHDTSNNKLFMFKNTDGLGSFGSSILIDNFQANRASLKMLDLDVDGDLDIIMTLQENSVSWFENTNGLGGFTTLQPISNMSSLVISLAIGDIDGDNDSDFLTASGQNGNVEWNENIDGQGTFDTSQLIDYFFCAGSGYCYYPKSTLLVDVDGDGDLDSVIAQGKVNYKSFVSWNENLDGQGNFGARKDIIQDLFLTDYAKPVDIDLDGDLDIFTSSTYRINWYENSNGEGADFLQKPIGDTQFQSNSFAYPKDINNDGAVDIIASNLSGLIWYENLNNGTGEFSAFQVINSTETIDDILIEDIDGDGDNDIIYFSTSEDHISFFENLNGIGDFGASQNMINMDYPISMNTSDIDNDGDLDLFVGTNSSGGNFAWYENLDGQGTFGTEHLIDSPCLTNSNLQLFSADFNSDGYLDFISVCSSSINWYENIDGLGNFSTPQEIDSGLNIVNSLSAIDMDTDGDMDVLAVIKSTNSVVWYENLDGIGTFSEAIIINDAEGLLPSLPGDINGDFKPDVLIASTSSVSAFNILELSWFGNLGQMSNQIYGEIIFDIENDGCNGTGIPISNLMVIAEDTSNSISTFTYQNGYYSMLTNEGVFDTFLSPELPGYFTPNPTMYEITFNGIGNSYEANYCVAPVGNINDANITFYPLSEARPGFEATYQVVINNIGTNVLTGDATITFDDAKIEFLSASETVSSQTSNSLTFNYSNLTPFETRTIELIFNVYTPSTTQNGDILEFTSIVNPVSGDITEEDNIFILEQEVIGSQDPNDILVLEGNQILVDDVDNYLHYIIRFQNIGTASAINILITNILDPNLDWNTLQLESFSHPMSIEISDGNFIKFTFEDINLPSNTTNEPDSHGFITYKIKPRSTVGLDDSMSNKAEIFFDYNPPISTNMVTTTVVEFLSIEEIFLDKIKIYPNPTNDVLNIESNGLTIENIIVFSLQGVILKEVSYKNKIDISEFASGIYFIIIKVDGNSYTKKLIKE